MAIGSHVVEERLEMVFFKISFLSSTRILQYDKCSSIVLYVNIHNMVCESSSFQTTQDFYRAAWNADAV